MRFSGSAIAGMAAAAMLALGAMTGTADAALVGCSPGDAVDLTGRVTSGGNVAVSACQYLTPPDPSNTASITNINAAGFFGFSD